MADLVFDKQLLKALISDDQAGNVGALQGLWFDRFCQRASTTAKVPDRATFYRWRNGKLPRSKTDLLRLCSVLDIDPLGAVIPPLDKEAEAILQLYRSFWIGHWKQPALNFLTDFFGHHVVWPPNSISREYFGRDWHTFEFDHDPADRVNYYTGIKIFGNLEVTGRRPQVFHFAYSQPNIFGQRWIQYGYVRRHLRMVQLVNITGDIQSYEEESSELPSCVETWCGPAAVSFRVASLHSFDAERCDSDADTFHKVRFNA